MVEHPLHITADGDWMFPEPQKDPQQAGTQWGTRQKVVIQALTLKYEGTIENYPVFAIIVHHVMWDEP